MAWSLEERSRRLREQINWVGTDLEFQEFLSRFIEAIPESHAKLHDAMHTYYRDPKEGPQEGAYFYQRTMAGRIAIDIFMSIVRDHPEIIDLVRQAEDRA